MLDQLMYRSGLLKSLRKRIIVYMNICRTHLKLEKCLLYVTLTEFWKLKATCNISPEIADDFERDEADTYL